MAPLSLFPPPTQALVTTDASLKRSEPRRRRNLAATPPNPPQPPVPPDPPPDYRSLPHLICTSLIWSNTRDSTPPLRLRLCLFLATSMVPLPPSDPTVSTSRSQICCRLKLILHSVTAATMELLLLQHHRPPASLAHIGNRCLSMLLSSPVCTQGQLKGYDTNCKRCGLPETELHIIYESSFAEVALERMPIVPQPFTLTTSSVDTLFLQAQLMITLPPCGITTPLFPWIFWQEWQLAQSLKTEHSPHVSTAFNYKPSPTTISSFVKASWHTTTLLSGSGWCFLDPHIIPLVQGFDTHRLTSSALMAKTIALKAAITAAISLEFLHLNVFSDPQSLDSLLPLNGDVNELRSVLVDIRSLLETFSYLSFFFVSRSANVYADALLSLLFCLCKLLL